MTRQTAIVIGSGIGGIACAIRLQSLGFDTQIVEQLDAPRRPRLCPPRTGLHVRHGGRPC